MNKKNGFHSSDFQKRFYDRLGKTKADDGGMLSCSFEERYNPRMIVDDRHTFDLFADLFAPLFEGVADPVVLDMCSGTGMHLPVLNQFPGTIIGADLSFGLLEVARGLKRDLQLNSTLLVQSLAEKIPLKDDTCDAIIMIDAIHHVEDQAGVMKELSRVAKPNAPFLLIEPNVSNPLVYLAHRIPVEERGALRSNTVRGLTELVRPYIHSVTVQPFNYVASRKSNPVEKAAFQVIEWGFKTLFFFWPIRILLQGRFKK
jgi:ubiquinone/menaquinone biosynthesis C-methylase UbiE